MHSAPVGQAQHEGGRVWLRRTIENVSDEPFHGLLSVPDPLAQDVVYYIAEPGSLYQRLDAPVVRSHRIWVGNLEIPAGAQRTVLVGVRLPPGAPSLELWAPSTFSDAQARADWALGLLFGIIMAMTLYFLAGTMVLRNQACRAFLPFLAGMCLLSYAGLGYAAAHWSALSGFVPRVVFGSLALTLGAASVFARYFLRSEESHPGLTRLFKAVEFTLVGAVALSVLGVQTPGLVVMALLSVTTALTLRLVAYRARQGQVHVLLLGAGWIPLTVVALVSLHLMPAWLYRGPFEPPFLVCAVACVLLFALAVAERLAAKRDEREFALSKSEERYIYASRGTHDGIFDWDLTVGRVYLSPRFFDTVRLPHNSLSEDPRELLDLIHKEDRETIYRSLLAQFKDHSLDNVQLEFRGLFGDHSVRWVSVRGLVVRDEGAVTRLVGSVTDTHVRKLNELKLERRAYSDEVTGLPNRARVEQYLQTLLDIQREDPSFGFGVLFIDLDRFKNVNDSLGHLVGDQLLTTLGHRLALVARDEDLVGRLGGDEFVVVLAGCLSVADVEGIGQRILAAFEDPVCLEGIEVRSSASIGITHSQVGYETVTDVLADADMAMYEAKRAGKSRWVTFDASMRDKAVVRLSMEADLRQSVEAGDFEIYYQPIIAADGRRLAGFEALMRWQHPRRGFVSPVDFIPLAEETGLIRKLGNFALCEATRQIAEWGARIPGAEDWFITVNVSPAQFGGDLLGEVAEALERADLAPSRLHLEITEGLFIDDAGSVQAEMEALANYGVTFSLDDFGTGYSSLSYLHKLPFATLKIDRAFIQSLLEEDQSEAIVKSVLALAQGLGLQTIAEGVETAEIADRLGVLGSSYFQGYFFGRPLAASALEEDLRAKGFLQSRSA